MHSELQNWIWFNFRFKMPLGTNLEDREREICSSVCQFICGREEEEAIGDEGGCEVMIGGMLVWLLSFFVLIGLLGLLVYQLMCLADLEFDYINPYDAATRVNKLVLPEYFTQGGLCVFFLLTGHWAMALLGLPYAYYNYRLYNAKRHLVDVTEIFNVLNHEKMMRLFKLGYLVCLLFLSIFWMIVCALQEES